MGDRHMKGKVALQWTAKPYIHVAEAGERHGCASKEKITTQHRQLVPKHVIHGAQATAGVRHIHNVIVQERSGVNQFSAGGQIITDGGGKADKETQSYVISASLR
jgi:hypothetical protein